MDAFANDADDVLPDDDGLGREGRQAREERREGLIVMQKNRLRTQLGQGHPGHDVPRAVFHKETDDI